TGCGPAPKPSPRRPVPPSSPTTVGSAAGEPRGCPCPAGRSNCPRTARPGCGSANRPSSPASTRADASSTCDACPRPMTRPSPPPSPGSWTAAMTDTPPNAATAPGTFVIATAGHVAHGKSTLVSSLAGIEPDRWAEERRRGLTIGLGFAWTSLPAGRELAFAGVPGHEKFLANMLAGLGPAPIACFVIAADKRWQAQSSDHRDAIAALGITHGLVVITRADLAPDTIDATEAEVRAHMRGTPLETAPIVTVSATTGEGLDELITVLDEVTDAAQAPDASARVRLWVDRAFTIRGAGTVVTGTLTAGRLRTGETVRLHGESIDRTVSVRGLQSRNSSTAEVVPQARVAVNLRDVPAEELHRGDALLTPDA